MSSEAGTQSNGRPPDTRLLMQIAQGILTSHVRLDQMEERLASVTSGAVADHIGPPARKIDEAGGSLRDQIDQLASHVQALQSMARDAEDRLDEATELAAKSAEKRFDFIQEKLSEGAQQAIRQEVSAPISEVKWANSQFETQLESLQTRIDALSELLERGEVQVERASAAGIESARTELASLGDRVAAAAADSVTSGVGPPMLAIQEAGRGIAVQTEVLSAQLRELEEFASAIDRRLEQATALGMSTARSLMDEFDIELQESSRDTIRETLSDPVADIVRAREGLAGVTSSMAAQLVQFAAQAAALEANLRAASVESITTSIEPRLREMDSLRAGFLDLSDRLRSTHEALELTERRLYRELPLAIHTDIIKQMAPILRGLETETRTTIWTSREVLHSVDLIADAVTAGLARFLEQARTDSASLTHNIDTLRTESGEFAEVLFNRLQDDQAHAVALVQDAQTDIGKLGGVVIDFQRESTEQNERIQQTLMARLGALEEKLASVEKDLKAELDANSRQTAASIANLSADLSRESERARADAEQAHAALVFRASKNFRGMATFGAIACSILFLEHFCPTLMEHLYEQERSLGEAPQAGIAVLILFFMVGIGVLSSVRENKEKPRP